MTDLVLVHGGWQGGWCWDGVAARLRAAGHRVLAPTLRGSEPEGASADRGEVGLSAVGDDLVRRVREAGFSDLVLIGHSGGGPVVQHAADRLGADVRRTVFVDAFVQRDGESTLDLQPSAPVFRRLAAARPDRSVPLDPDRFVADFMNGADETLVASTVTRLVPLPLRQLEEPLRLEHPERRPRLGIAYVFLQDDRSVDPTIWRRMAQRLHGPEPFSCVGPHEAMLTHPDELAEVLLRASGAERQAVSGSGS